MTLVDTSVWVDHLRGDGHPLATLLAEGRVLCHPFVVGELACGSLSNRDRFLELLGALPQAQIADHEDVLLALVIGSDSFRAFWSGVSEFRVALRDAHTWRHR